MNIVEIGKKGAKKPSKYKRKNGFSLSEKLFLFRLPIASSLYAIHNSEYRPIRTRERDRAES